LFNVSHSKKNNHTDSQELFVGETVTSIVPQKESTEKICLNEETEEAKKSLISHCLQKAPGYGYEDSDPSFVVYRIDNKNKHAMVLFSNNYRHHKVIELSDREILMHQARIDWLEPKKLLKYNHSPDNILVQIEESLEDYAQDKNLILNNL